MERSGVLTLVARSVEFLGYRLLLSLVDRVSRLPRDRVMPEAMRLYRENIALKAQLDALTHDLRLLSRRPRASIRTRAAQVFALMLTRGNRTFHRYYLSAALGTIERWAEGRKPKADPMAKRTPGIPGPSACHEAARYSSCEKTGWVAKKVEERTLAIFDRYTYLLCVFRWNLASKNPVLRAGPHREERPP